MIRASLAMLVVCLLLPGACDVRRGEVASQPGETPRELDAAARALSAAAGGTPLVEVRVLAAEGREERRAVGAVVGEHQRVIVDVSAISLSVGDGSAVAHTRSIEVVFHPGGEDERRIPASVLRESKEEGLALLSLDAGDAPALELSDDLPDDAPVFLISAPMNLTRLVAESGRVRGYAVTGSGRSLLHTAGRQEEVTGGRSLMTRAHLSVCSLRRLTVKLARFPRWRSLGGCSDRGPTRTRSPPLLGRWSRGCFSRWT